MSPRFSPGSSAFAKDGRRYVVDEVVNGIVYCSSPAGAETEFQESQLMNAAEWTARSAARPELSYERLRATRTYAPFKGKVERAGAEQLLAKAERMLPGLLDFAAYTAACKALAETNDHKFEADLSIPKCRELFDSLSPETRAAILAGMLGAAPEVFTSAGRLGDNLMRAMVEKGLSKDPAAFEAFRGRLRR